jgi:hypothetical protein
MSHFRIIVDNIAKYGYSVSFFSTSSDEIDNNSQWSVPQPFLVILSWSLILLIVYFIEILAQKRYLSDRATLIIQILISAMNLIGSCCWVWFSRCHPVWGILYLIESVILWMKMISYVHCNRLPTLSSLFLNFSHLSLSLSLCLTLQGICVSLIVNKREQTIKALCLH